MILILQNYTFLIQLVPYKLYNYPKIVERPFTFYVHHPICNANRGTICGIAAAASTDDVNRNDTTPFDGK